jgi:hypothetical protein
VEVGKRTWWEAEQGDCQLEVGRRPPGWDSLVFALQNTVAQMRLVKFLNLPNPSSSTRPWGLLSLKQKFFCNPILLAICTTTFSKLCKNMYTVACRRVLSSAPL